MGGRSVSPDPAAPGGAEPNDVTTTFTGRDPGRPEFSLPGGPSPAPAEAAFSHPPPAHPATELAAQPGTGAVTRQDGGPHQATRAAVHPAADYVRYGPGVPETPPPSQAAASAERIWRTGAAPRPPRRSPRLRRVLGSALTVVLLGAAAVILFLRFHTAPLHVTGAAISQQTRTRCGVNVTGQIATNGSGGTVSYQWLFTGDSRAPQPLTQTVSKGQHDVFVTVAVQGSGHGTAAQAVTLQVLGPDRESASTTVVVRC